MAAIPIWKDKIIDLGSTSILFRLRDSDTRYTGKATARPGVSTAKVRVNDICADLLSNSLPSITDRTFTSFGLQTYYLEKSTNGVSWTSVDNFMFYNDWSYDYGFTGNSLSDPITGRVTSDMYILSSSKEISSNVSATYRKSNNSTTSRSTTVSPTPNHGTCCFYAGAVSDTVRITINSKNYYIATGCFKYALYYVNDYGGWDQFLIEGQYLESDSMTRYTKETEYTNTDRSNRGTDNYVNEVVKSWTLHTGLMTDSQAAKMHHLLNSTMVYLCDIPYNTYVPVIITDTTCEYKTYKNQGRQMVTYTITVELAQNRIRR